MASFDEILEGMEPDRMTDLGMWIWIAILTVAFIGASYAIAVWWQKRKDNRQA